MLSQNDYDLLVLYREERPYPENEDDQERFELFRANGWVRDTRFESLQSGNIIMPLNPTHFIVSEMGKDLLEAFEEQAAQEEKRQAEKEAAEARRLQERHEDYANAERRYRTQNKISVLGILVPFLTFLLGVYVEYRLALLTNLVRLIE